LGKVVRQGAGLAIQLTLIHPEKEYDFYTKLLLYFLDPEKISGSLKDIDAEKNKRNFYKPDNEAFSNPIRWLNCSGCSHPF
jgi:arginine deiminase